MINIEKIINTVIFILIGAILILHALIVFDIMQISNEGVITFYNQLN